MTDAFARLRMTPRTRRVILQALGEAGQQRRELVASCDATAADHALGTCACAARSEMAAEFGAVAGIVREARPRSDDEASSDHA